MKKFDTQSNTDELQANWIIAGFITVLVLSVVIYYTIVA